MVESVKNWIMADRITSMQEILISTMVVSALVSFILLVLRPPMVCVAKKNDWQVRRVSFIKTLVYVLLSTAVTISIIVVKNYI